MTMEGRKAPVVFDISWLRTVSKAVQNIGVMTVRQKTMWEQQLASVEKCSINHSSVIKIAGESSHRELAQYKVVQQEGGIQEYSSVSRRTYSINMTPKRADCTDDLTGVQECPILSETSMADETTERDTITPHEISLSSQVQQAIVEHRGHEKQRRSDTDWKVLPVSLIRAPLHVRYECLRLLDSDPHVLQLLTTETVESLTEYDNMKRLFHQCAEKSGVILQPSRLTVWNEASTSFDAVVMSGEASLQLVDKIPKLCHVKLHALSLGGTSRMTRAFGGHRFFRLTVRINSRDFGKLTSVPSTGESLLSDFFESRISLIAAQWQVWRISQDSVEEQTSSARYVVLSLDLFAVSISGMCPKVLPVHLRPNPIFFTRRYIPISDLMSWLVDLEANQDLSIPRAFPRLDLATSKSMATLIFQPSQIRSISHILANGEPEATEFADTGLEQPPSDGTERNQVMNDGCARLSVEAGRLIAQKLGLEGPTPSVFQARLGGCKGVWMVSTACEDGTEDPIWLEVTPSQRKLNAHAVDLRDETYDPRRTTFEVLGYSRTLRAARLSHTMLPVLVDRGVTEETIQALYRNVLEQDHQTFLTALMDPRRLHQWIASRCSDLDNTADEWLGGLPWNSSAAALYLLEHGFDPHTDSYLAGLVRKLADEVFSPTMKTLNLRLTSSVMPYGIADPTQCLAPGEIYLSFFTTYFDSHLGRPHPCLSNMEVLVGRHPVIRPSDIQKVRAVFKVELVHIQDSVVFPSRGTIPLAAQMSNGDYDGDHFWVCWHPELVAGFRNAPAPRSLPEPADIGIKTTILSVSDIYTARQKTATTRAYLRAGLRTRTRPSLKGLSRWCYDNFVYTHSHRDPRATFLADLHELLMDAEKSGIELDRAEFRSILTAQKILPDNAGRQPLYKQLLTRGAKSDCGRPHLPHQVVDRILVQIITPETEVFKHRRQSVLKTVNGIKGNTLECTFQTFRNAQYDGDGFARNTALVKGRLRDLHTRWSQMFQVRPPRDADDRKDRFAQIRKLHEDYTKIPFTAEKTIDCDLSYRRDQCGPPTYGALVKASILWTTYGSTPFVFRLAGRELAFLKAWSSSMHVRSIVPSMCRPVISGRVERGRRDIGSRVPPRE